MPSNPSYYWDACVLLAFIKAETGRVADVQGLLDAANKQRVELLSSTLSIVEVSNAVTQASGMRDRAAEQAIDNLWLPPSPIQLVEFHRLIAEAARDLMRRAVDLARKLTPLDAVHLATAKHMDVDVLHTYDPDLIAWSGELGIPIEEPKATALPML